jgi:hypothetical protein
MALWVTPRAEMRDGGPTSGFLAVMIFAPPSWAGPMVLHVEQVLLPGIAVADVRHAHDIGPTHQEQHDQDACQPPPTSRSRRFRTGAGTPIRPQPLGQRTVQRWAGAQRSPAQDRQTDTGQRCHTAGGFGRG